MKPVRSIRTRLLLWLLVPLTLIAAFEATETYFTARKTSNSLYDKTLLAVMFTVAENVLASDGDLLSENVLEVLTENLGDQLFYHVAGPDNTFVTGYSGYPRPPAGVELKRGRPVFYDGVYKGEPVRVVAIRQLVTERDLNGWITVTAWQTVNRRAELSLELFGQSLLRLAILVGCAGLIVWFALRIGLSPLADLQDAVERRSSSDLSAIRRPVPVEVQSLVTAMNALFEKVRTAADARERFIADAAHQLRNPIAALKAQAQVARKASTPEEMRRRIDGVVQSIDAAGRLVHQLLTSASANAAGTAEEDTTVFDLVRLSRDTASTHAQRAIRKGQEFSFDICEETLPVAGNSTLVGEAIANLIDNAIVHNPPGTTIKVAVGRQDGLPTVTVEDDGIGIPETDQSKVLEPFVSLQTESAGSGLGLSIVADIARQHKGHLSALPGCDGKGARFELSLAPAAG